MRTKGFTVMELLLVFVIMATLAAILLPTFVLARGSAKRSVCLNHQKEIGLAMVMYAGDYDDRFPAVANGYERLSDGVDHEISWMAVIQPYAERLMNLTERGKSKSNLDAARGEAQLFLCPSQIADPRASVNYVGAVRLSSGGVGVSYALPPYAYSSRSQAEFNSLTGTVLVGEQYLNFTATYYYPVDWDNDPGSSRYGVDETATNDCRFDRGEDCTFAAGTFPAHPDAMPGISGRWISNLARWHGTGLNLVFADGHVRYTQRGQTYKTDGSFSAWTISNRWTRA